MKILIVLAACFVVVLVVLLARNQPASLKRPHPQAAGSDVSREEKPPQAKSGQTKQHLEAFTAQLDLANKRAGHLIARHVAVKGHKATITVDDAWHLIPYQARLQTAQNIWKTWADIASPADTDKARISLVDTNGNEVGGSRALGGSLVWVQER